MRGLPPKLMSIAVGAAWILAGLPFLSYAAAAGVTLAIAWFITKKLKLR